MLSKQIHKKTLLVQSVWATGVPRKTYILIYLLGTFGIFWHLLLDRSAWFCVEKHKKHGSKTKKLKNQSNKLKIEPTPKNSKFLFRGVVFIRSLFRINPTHFLFILGLGVYVSRKDRMCLSAFHRLQPTAEACICRTHAASCGPKVVLKRRR